MRAAPRLRAGAASAGLAAAAAWLAVATPVGAYIPQASKIAAAVAAQNRDADRSEQVGVRVVLRDAGGEVMAEGRLLSDPRGSARLELREEDGSIERHLLRGGRHLAARDGEMLDRARPLVPPLYLLQAASAAALREQLAALGADPDEVALGHTELHDCYVLGGRTRSPQHSRRAGGSTPRAPEAGAARPRGPSRLPPLGHPTRAALWADIETFEIVRIDYGGARFELGPLTDLGGARLPSWIAVRTPAGVQGRLEVRERSRVTGSAGSLFTTTWLRAP